jgi:acetyl esterase
VALWTALAATPPGSAAAEAPLQPPAALILFSAISDTSTETGYTPGRFGENATALSPIHQLSPRMPPVLMFHGDADKTVPFRQARAPHEPLLAGGNASELVVVPDGDHNFSTQLPEWKSQSREIVRAFLASRNLLPAAATQSRAAIFPPPLP